MIYDVLFVDDEPQNLTVFEAACADRFRVLTANSARRALELLRRNEVHVLLADQRMPEMTGLELLERARTEHPEVVRMLLTAYADLQTAVDAINRGEVRRYLKKPWEHAELLSTLAEGVDYYQMRARLVALERRLLETERVYSLGVVTAGLARELSGPISALGGHVTRARELLHAAYESVPASAQGGPALRAKLVDADEQLGEAVVDAQRALDVARGVEIPIGPIERQDVNVSEVLRLTLRLIQQELRAAGSVEFDVRPVPLVLGSPAQLAHVMLNVLVNVFDSMADTPSEHRELRIRLFHEEPWVVFEVGSPGRGAAGEREGSAHAPSPGEFGRGLGLATSRSIVEELGGEFAAEGSAVTGTLRRVKLPRKPSSSA